MGKLRGRRGCWGGIGRRWGGRSVGVAGGVVSIDR